MALVLPLKLAATLTDEQRDWLDRNYARMDADTQAKFHRMLSAPEPVHTMPLATPSPFHA